VLVVLVGVVGWFLACCLLLFGFVLVVDVSWFGRFFVAGGSGRAETLKAKSSSSSTVT
jgi:hypothetical protein